MIEKKLLTDQRLKEIEERYRLLVIYELLGHIQYMQNNLETRIEVEVANRLSEFTTKGIRTGVIDPKKLEEIFGPFIGSVYA